MNQFTIRDIENLCGIKAHTLRIWEQRYKLFIARRKESQHRIYDNEDLKELLRIAFLYHNGHKISRIAELSKEDIYKLIQTSSAENDNYSIYIHQLLEAAIDFDKEKFEKTVNCVVVRVGLEKCITEVFYPLLQRIGLLWMTNNMIPAQEHFTSHIIRKKIILATDGLDTVSRAKTNTIVFAPLGEFHEIPLLVANYFFKKNGHQTAYFGTNVSIDCIRHYAGLHEADRLYTHIITHMDNCGMARFVDDIHKLFPDKQIIISGPAIKCVQQLPQNIVVIQSLREMIEFTQQSNGEIKST